MTLADLKAQCVIDDTCWLWQGRLSRGGRPVAMENGSTYSVRRRALKLFSRKPIPDLPVTYKCNEPTCINPRHSVSCTQKELVAIGKERGQFKRSAVSVARLSLSKRRASGRDIEVAREVRRRCAAGERQMLVAAAVGMSQANVSKIVRQKTWRELGGVALIAAQMGAL